MAKTKEAVTPPEAKPKLSEVFAALAGVSCAAVTVAKSDADTSNDPLCGTGTYAAIKALDARERLLRHEATTALQEELVRDCLQYLKAATSILIKYPDVRLSLPKGAQGGTTQDLVAHIDDMLKREKNCSEPRLSEKFVNGLPTKKYDAKYLPKARKEDAENNGYEESEGNEANPAPTTKPVRHRSNAWSGPAFV